MFSMVLVGSGIRIPDPAIFLYGSGSATLPTTVVCTHTQKVQKTLRDGLLYVNLLKKPVFRIRVLLSGSGANFFFLSPDPDRQKIRIRSEKSGSRSMKKRPKNGCTSKKMLHIAYLALKSQGCPNVSFLTLLRISELVSFRWGWRWFTNFNSKMWWIPIVVCKILYRTNIVCYDVVMPVKLSVL